MYESISTPAQDPSVCKDLSQAKFESQSGAEAALSCPQGVWQGSTSPRERCHKLLPSRLQGFLLKRALSKLWASTLRNCGIPSLALKNKHTQAEKELLKEGVLHFSEDLLIQH